MRHLLPILATTWLACVPTLADAAAAWQVDPRQSRLVFIPKIAGGEFEGRFVRYSAAIAFDPADLAQSHFTVDVDLAGAATGDAERDAVLHGAEFFAIGRWPHAVFEATRFQALGDGRYEARGTLQLRDVTREIRVPFQFEASAGTAARLTGTTSIRRLHFGVGQGEWRDTDWVADEVRVEFDLHLRRTP